MVVHFIKRSPEAESAEISLERLGKVTQERAPQENASFHYLVVSNEVSTVSSGKCRFGHEVTERVYRRSLY